MLSFVNMFFKGNKLSFNNEVDLTYDEVYVIQRLLDSLLDNNQAMNITYNDYVFKTVLEQDPVSQQQMYRLIIHYGPGTYEIVGDNIKFQALRFALLRLITMAVDKFIASNTPSHISEVSNNIPEPIIQNTAPEIQPINNNIEPVNIVEETHNTNITPVSNTQPIVEVQNYNPEIIDDLVKTLYGLVLSPKIDDESVKKIEGYLQELGIKLNMSSLSALDITLTTIKELINTIDTKQLKQHLLVDVDKLGNEEIKKYVQDKLINKQIDAIRPMFVAFRILTEMQEFETLAGGL